MPLHGERHLLPAAGVTDSFGEQLVLSGEKKRLYVTLGQFSTVRLERETQITVPTTEYSAPRPPNAAPTRGCEEGPASASAARHSQCGRSSPIRATAAARMTAAAAAGAHKTEGTSRSLRQIMGNLLTGKLERVKYASHMKAALRLYSGGRKTCAAEDRADSRPHRRACS